MSRWGVVLSVAVVAVVAVMGLAVPAAAHGGESDVEVVSSEPEATGIRYVVRVTYENDGDPIGAATVTATVTDASGVPQPPVPLVYSADGRYSALVPAPVGLSAVHFAVTEPEGTLDIVQTFTPVTAAPPTAVAPLPTAAPVTGGDSVTRGSSPTVEEDESGSSATFAVVGGVVAIVVAGLIVLQVRRSRTAR